MNIKIILESLGTLIGSLESVTIDIENISILNDGDEFFESKSPTVLSIINIEEDKTLRNQSVYLNKTSDFHERYEHPTKHLIISLLFSAYSNKPNKYLDGLDKLNKVIVFFQKNTSLYFHNTSATMIRYKDFLGKVESEQKEYSKIVFETISLSLEQLNQMWSYLGSKYMPSILIKMRLIEVTNEKIPSEPLINSFKINMWENNTDDPLGLLESVKYESTE